MNLVSKEKNAQRGFMSGLNMFCERSLLAPFLFAVQSILQLYLINITELDFSEILRSLFISLVFASAVFFGGYLFLRDWVQASLTASVFIIFFFLFGDITDWASSTLGLGPTQANFAGLVFVSGCMIFWIGLLRFRIKNILFINLYFNAFSIMIVFFMPAIQIVTYVSDNGVSLPLSNRPIPVVMVETATARPDIYYIILDGYGRKDILQALYQFDNSNLVSALEDLGFYVAGESASNYIQTLLSISSALNMDYLQSIKAHDENPPNRGDLTELINHNMVRAILAQKGYHTVSFYNEYRATISSADIYYVDARMGFFQPVTALESHILNQSMVRVLACIPAFKNAMLETPYDTHRQSILSTFARLREIPALEGDYFVYAHIIAPHPPFVFDENGNSVSHDRAFTLSDASHFARGDSRADYITGYRLQIQHVNRLLLETVDAIIAGSKTPPIIIIQGDHGPGAYLDWESLEQTIPAERFGILNAYYFPDQDYTSLYPAISPVNSFRILMNQFFNGTYTIFPDWHYYSSWEHPFDFIEVKKTSLP